MWSRLAIASPQFPKYYHSRNIVKEATSIAADAGLDDAVHALNDGLPERGVLRAKGVRAWVQEHAYPLWATGSLLFIL